MLTKSIKFLNNMKKNIILFTALLLSGIVFSQVGVNTNLPKATLDVVGKPTTTDAIDGIIAPRISGDQLKAKDAVYTAAQNGTFVYVTDVPSTSSTGKTEFIKYIGYYYYDATISKWTPMKKTKFYTKKYVITNANLDWVENFNTKIDATKYTVLVTNAYYNDIVFTVEWQLKEYYFGSQTATHTGVNWVEDGNTYTATFNTDNFRTEKLVDVFVTGGTWRITADYPISSSKKAGSWTIDVLIIAKDDITTLSTETFNLGGSQSGAAVTSPL